MPAPAIKSLINAFEATSVTSSPPRKANGPPPTPRRKPAQPLPIANGSASSQTSSENLLEAPASPTATNLSLIAPLEPTPSSSRSASPAILGRKTSLIDLKEFEFPPPTAETGPVVSITPIGRTGDKKAPPLPPRKVSSSSSGSSIMAPSTSNTLSVDHAYPPIRPTKHMPTSSISSFQSVSLSSDGGKRESMNIDDSIEIISHPIPSSSPPPLKPKPAAPPRLPPRPSPSSSTANAIPKRRPPPPPPAKPTKVKTAPTTEPAAFVPQAKLTMSKAAIDAITENARARYSALFDKNIDAQNKLKLAVPPKRPSRAWRGPSVDFTTTSIKPPDDPSRERLDGRHVKAIWDCSKLSKAQLRRIWAQCNPSLHSSLDRESFVRGMWLIDEELRHMQRTTKRKLRWNGP